MQRIKYLLLFIFSIWMFACPVLQALQANINEELEQLVTGDKIYKRASRGIDTLIQKGATCDLSKNEAFIKKLKKGVGEGTRETLTNLFSQYWRQLGFTEAFIQNWYNSRAGRTAKIYLEINFSDILEIHPKKELHGGEKLKYILTQKNLKLNLKLIKEVEKLISEGETCDITKNEIFLEKFKRIHTINGNKNLTPLLLKHRQSLGFSDGKLKEIYLNSQNNDFKEYLKKVFPELFGAPAKIKIEAEKNLIEQALTTHRQAITEETVQKVDELIKNGYTCDLSKNNHFIKKLIAHIRGTKNGYLKSIFVKHWRVLGFTAEDIEKIFNERKYGPIKTYFLLNFAEILSTQTTIKYIAEILQKDEELKKYGITHLIYAIQQGCSSELLQAILEEYPEQLEQKDFVPGYTPLQYAVLLGNEEAQAILQAYGAQWTDKIHNPFLGGLIADATLENMKPINKEEDPLGMFEEVEENKEEPKEGDVIIMETAQEIPTVVDIQPTDPNTQLIPPLPFDDIFDNLGNTDIWGDF